MSQSWFAPRRRPVWGAVLALLLVIVLLSVPSVRAWASGLLQLFRVQEITPISIDTTALGDLNGNTALGEQIGKLISSATTVVKKPGPPQTAGDAAEASQKAGFTVRLPAKAASQPLLSIRPDASYRFVIDRAKAQALIDTLGRSDLQLPANLDGANITLEIPAGVTAAYGSCPSLEKEEVDVLDEKHYPHCILFAQIPSPTVQAPPDLDVAGLADIALQLTGMPSEQAQAFSQSVDWTSSLVIPIPRNAATYEQVQVDGVTGTLIQRPANDAPQYVLLWVKDGIIYAIASDGTDNQSAIDMANSLQ